MGKRETLRPAVKLQALSPSSSQMRSARKKHWAAVPQCFLGMLLASAYANEEHVAFAAHKAWQSCHVLRAELAIHTPGSLKCFAQIVFLLTTSHCSEIGVWPSNVWAASSAGDSQCAEPRKLAKRTAARREPLRAMVVTLGRQRYLLL